MRIRIAQAVFNLLLLLFILAVITQFVLAGMAVFVDPIQWRNHSMFVHLFGFNLPVIMLIAAWLANMPLKVYGGLLGLMGLIFFMYFTANIAGTLPWVAALHPIVGIILLITSGLLLIDQVKTNKKEKV